MAEDHASVLAAIESRWMTGGSAFEAAPAEWADITGDDPGEGELRLLALAGQLAQVMFRPKPPETMTQRGALPMPALPILPDAARTPFRAAMKSAGSNAIAGHILALLESRGYSAHPFDWMPDPRNADLPDTYLPLAQWVAKGEAQFTQSATLSAENWDDFFPAARQAALAGMRVSNPETALLLLAQKFGGEPAEIRTALMAVFAINPSEADIPFLESLASDRSGKVQAAARQFLARLGRHPAEASVDAAEFVEAKTTGILKRTQVFEPAKLKTAGQIERRRALFAGLTLEALATSFSCDELSFLSMWRWDKDAECNSLLIDLATRSAPDETVHAFAAMLFGITDRDPRPFGLLADRLKDADIRRWHEFIAEADLTMIGDTLDHGLRLYGRMSADRLFGGKLFKQVLAAFGESDARGQARAAPALNILGLLADRPAAEAMLEKLREAGVGIGARETSLLRLNSQLDHTTNSSPGT